MIAPPIRDSWLMIQQYYIYLFERILLCCKEIGTSKKQSKTMSMGKNSRTANAKKKSSLQLKGRIFMQNVTDVISLSRNGMRGHTSERAPHC